jgi:hypothetical protein
LVWSNPLILADKGTLYPVLGIEQEWV